MEGGELAEGMVPHELPHEDGPQSGIHAGMLTVQMPHLGQKLHLPGHGYPEGGPGELKSKGHLLI